MEKVGKVRESWESTVTFSKMSETDVSFEFAKLLLLLSRSAHMNLFITIGTGYMFFRAENDISDFFFIYV
jgi:hypothetical protein